MKPVKKAVLTAAGLGTRFLPQTKAMPKEMLPIVDKPVIQIIVEEIVAAGVTDIIIVTGASQRAVEEHFERSLALEEALRAKGKDKQADRLKSIAELANFIYIRQKNEPGEYGNAIPVKNAMHLLDNEPFYVFFPDDFFISETPRALQLLDTYQKTGKSTISLIEVERGEASKYGMVSVADNKLGEHSVRIRELIEKPGPDRTPSTFASVSGYLLTPDILPLIDNLQPSERGEIELAGAINQLAQKDEVYGRFIQGTRHDAGNIVDYLKAVVDVALANPKIRPELQEFINERVEK